MPDQDYITDLSTQINYYMETIELDVPDLHQRTRIDHFLVHRIGKISRSKIVQGLKNGQILLNGQRVKPGKQVLFGDKISLVLSRPDIPPLQPEPMHLDILYEDQELLVINKPAGVVMHPTRQHFYGTLVSGVLYYLKNQNPNTENTGIIHRLDQETSGLVLFAKNKTIQRHMMQLFQNRKIEKLYKALVLGNPTEIRGKIETNIGRGQVIKERREVYPYKGMIGRSAITEYQVLENYKGFALIGARPLTGRTHQIRVHLKHIGHPVLGDKMYVEPNRKLFMERQALHAYSLRFYHPVSNQLYQFEAPLPLDMKTFIENQQCE